MTNWNVGRPAISIEAGNVTRRALCAVVSVVALAYSPPVHAASEVPKRGLEDIARQVAVDDSLMASKRHEIARALKPHSSGLWKALTRPAPLASDTAIVFASLRRAAAPSTPGDDKDMFRFAAQQWILWLLWDGESAAMARSLNRELKPLGVKLIGQDSVWEFQGANLTTPLLIEPWRNQWRERVLAEWMENLCEYGGDGTEWRQILERGREFLKHTPKSSRSPEVMLHMAEAHETYWSVANDSTGDYSSMGIRRNSAPEHRRKAIELYERYLRLQPKGEQADIRRRLKLIRANVNTYFWKYCCFSTC